MREFITLKQFQFSNIPTVMLYSFSIIKTNKNEIEKKKKKTHTSTTANIQQCFGAASFDEILNHCVQHLCTCSVQLEEALWGDAKSVAQHLLIDMGVPKNMLLCEVCPASDISENKMETLGETPLRLCTKNRTFKNAIKKEIQSCLHAVPEYTIFKNMLKVVLLPMLKMGQLFCFS